MMALWRALWMIVAVLAVTLGLAAFMAQQVAGGERCPFGVCKGERVVIYDNQGRRTGTVENRGFGVLQMRDSTGRRVGTIREDGQVRDSSNRRTGKIVTSGDTGRPWWR